MGLLNLFQGGKLKQEIKALTSQVIQLQSALTYNLSNSFVNQNIAVYPTWSEMKAGDKYCNIDDIYSIIRKLVNASLTVPMYPYYEKNKSAAKELKAFPIGGNVFHHKALQVKALEDLPETDPVYKLLQNPSAYQNAIEFYEELFSYLYIFGRVPLIKTRPEYGVNAGKPINLEVLIPNCLIPKVSEGFPKNTITGYDYEIGGRKVMENIPVEDIIMIKYFNPNSSTSSLSPIEVLKKRTTRMDANMDNSVAMMQNGGVNGIVYDKDTTPEGVEISGKRTKAFYDFLQNKSNKGAPYFSNGEMGYIALGLDMVDLDSNAIANADFKKLCNAYSLSDRLFNNDATGSEISDKNARRALYTDATLPNVFRVAAAIEHSLNSDFTDRKRIIQADISNIPELQQDSNTLATWLNTAWWVTPNEKRELMKFDRLGEPMFDKPIVPTGLVALEDLQGSGDLPDTEDYNA